MVTQLIFVLSYNTFSEFLTMFLLISVPLNHAVS